VPPTDQTRYYQEHPPRCLEAFATQAAPPPDGTLDGHGEELNTAFSVRCSCGEAALTILGHSWREPGRHGQLILLSPLRLSCPTCERTALLFDTDLHGYDAELGVSGGTLRGEGEPSPHVCPACDGASFEVVARFEYPDDLFDEEFDESRGHEQDLFTWFSLHGRCTSCGKWSTVAEFEGA
jgi:hypothetical protein